MVQVQQLLLRSALFPLPRFPLSYHRTTRSCRIYLRRMTSGSNAPSPKCPIFIPVEQTHINTSITKSPGPKFRVASYNILAQVYVKSSLFPHSPRSCLRWKTRSQAILTVLKSLEADILCLQELDMFDSFYKPNIENLGYSSIYIQRSGDKRDGCGIFYNPNIAELVFEERIEYNDLVDSVNEETITLDVEPSTNTKAPAQKDVHPDRGDPDDPRVRLKRDCVGIMAAFRLKDPTHHLVVVANTHIYWDPEWADVKLAQVKYLLSRLNKFSVSVSDKFECDPSVIVAGDFNSTPGDKVYQYLTSGDPSSPSKPECSDELPMPLRSLYAHARGREPTFTNCTPDFTNTLDYIFFSPSERIKPVSFLDLPELDSADVSGCLPNLHHPSDHLPIGADFEVIAD
uniref:Endonuclease/exonuclease/phosphatase domain-containing protein n=2 Tax=Kalanchoe fedtschenkoi TaxID=63787 RepID=A0A7N0VBX1_KALFE